MAFCIGKNNVRPTFGQIPKVNFGNDYYCFNFIDNSASHIIVSLTLAIASSQLTAL